MYVLQDRHLTMVLDVTTGSCCEESHRTKPTPVWEAPPGKCIFLSAAHCNWHFNKRLSCCCPSCATSLLSVSSITTGTDANSFRQILPKGTFSQILVGVTKCSCVYRVTLNPLPQLNKPGFMFTQHLRIRLFTERSLKGWSSKPSGIFALLSRDWVWGMLVSVERKTLERHKHTELELHAEIILSLVFHM